MTLTSLDRLRPRGAKFEIDLIDAMVANEMSRFGDCMLGTRPPLVFRLHVKQAGAVDSESSRAPVRVTDVDLLAGGRTLEDELERRIAFYFLRFGKWEVEQELQFGPGGDVVTVDLMARPPVVEDEEQAVQDFASVGMLSSLYAALFDEMTLSADGEVDQPRPQTRPRRAFEAHPRRLLGSTRPRAAAVASQHRAGRPGHDRTRLVQEPARGVGRPSSGTS